jgi:hypothetical protein
MPKPRAKPSSIHHIKNQQSSIVNPSLFIRIDGHRPPLQHTLCAKNQELPTLRDWLLPMLMDGQVRVG